MIIFVDIYTIYIYIVYRIYNYTWSFLSFPSTYSGKKRKNRRLSIKCDKQQNFKKDSVYSLSGPKEVISLDVDENDNVEEAKKEYAKAGTKPAACGENKKQQNMFVGSLSHVQLTTPVDRDEVLNHIVTTGDDGTQRLFKVILEITLFIIYIGLNINT